MRFGNPGAEWSFCPRALNEESVVYSFGVGTDISFDLGLIRQFGTVVHAFDPTPRSIEWVLSQDIPERFVFHEYGIAHFDGEAIFTPPADPMHVSYRMVPAGDAQDAVVTPVLRLESIAQQLGHSRLHLVKLDIEGAEFDVLEECLQTGPLIDQLLVEFHHRWRDIGLERTRHAIRVVERYGLQLIYVSPSGTEYAFLRNEERDVGESNP